MPVFVKASRRARAYTRSAGAKFGKMAKIFSKKTLPNQIAPVRSQAVKIEMATKAGARARQIQATRLKAFAKRY